MFKINLFLFVSFCVSQLKATQIHTHKKLFAPNTICTTSKPKRARAYKQQKHSEKPSSCCLPNSTQIIAFVVMFFVSDEKYVKRSHRHKMVGFMVPQCVYVSCAAFNLWNEIQYEILEDKPRSQIFAMSLFLGLIAQWLVEMRRTKRPKPKI